MTRGQIAFALIVCSFVVTAPHVKKRKGLLVLLLLLVMCASFVHQLAFRTIADDAFITFRYAYNLSSGHGAVFNVGERVEGYSNFLWMLLLSGLHSLLGVDIPAAAQFLGGLWLIITMGATYQLCLKTTDNSPVSSQLALLLLSASGSFVAYSLSGLETPLFSCLLVLSILYASDDAWGRTGLFAGLATMTRPEGSLCFGIYAAWLVFHRISFDDMIRKLARFACAFLLFVIPWTIWRVSYYGYWLPNTITAKMGMNWWYQIQAGFKYVYGFIRVNTPLGIVLLVVLLPPVLTHPFQKRSLILQRVDYLLLTFIGVFTAFIVYAGGDWMAAWRFFSPILPLIIVLSIHLIHRNIEEPMWRLQSARGIMMLGIISWALFMMSYSEVSFLYAVRSGRPSVNGWSIIGKWWQQTLPVDTLVATHANGAISYYSQLPTIDMLGLTDHHIAHSGKRHKYGLTGHIAYDYDYVVRRTPLVIYCSSLGFDPEPSHTYEKEEFMSLYVPVSFRFQSVKDVYGEYVNLLLLRSEQESLIQYLTNYPGVEVVPYQEQAHLMRK